MKNIFWYSIVVCIPGLLFPVHRKFSIGLVDGWVEGEGAKYPLKEFKTP
jgi:hypothetical protein